MTRERGHLGKSRGLLLSARPEERVSMSYGFIAEEQANNDSRWSVAEMCRALAVSRSGYYDWLDREPPPRAVGDAQLAIEIEAIWECSDRTYGSPRVHRWLRRQGFRVGPQAGGPDHASQRLGRRVRAPTRPDHDRRPRRYGR